MITMHFNGQQTKLFESDDDTLGSLTREQYGSIEYMINRLFETNDLEWYSQIFYFASYKLNYYRFFNSLEKAVPYLLKKSDRFCETCLYFHPKFGKHVDSRNLYLHGDY